MVDVASESDKSSDGTPESDDDEEPEVVRRGVAAANTVSAENRTFTTKPVARIMKETLNDSITKEVTTTATVTVLGQQERTFLIILRLLPRSRQKQRR